MPKRSAKKAKKIVVSKKENKFSPYLVNLHSVLKEPSGKNEEFFDEDLKKFSVFSKNTESPSPKIDGEFISIRQKTDKAVKKFFRPITIWFDNLEKKIKTFYSKHEDILGELMAVNILTASTLAIKKTLKLFYYIFIFIAGFFLQSVKLVTNFFRVLLNIFSSKSRAAGSRLFSLVKKIICIFFVQARVFIKKLLHLFYYPFIALYSNTKKYFKIFLNEILAFLSKLKFKGKSASHQLKEAVSQAGKQAKDGVRNHIIIKVRGFFKKVGKATSMVAEKSSSFLGRVFFWIKSFFSFKFLPPMSWRRQIAFFIIFAAVFIAPLKVFSYFNIFENVKGRVLGESESAISSLLQASDAGNEYNFAGAADYFSKASDNFNQAQLALSEYSKLIAFANIIPSKKTKLASAGKNIISSARAASEVGENIALALDSLQLDNTEVAKPLSLRLNEFSSYLESARERLNDFEEKINGVEEKALLALDMENKNEIASQVKLLKRQTGIFKKGLDEMISLGRFMSIFLGDQIDKRYLLIFQNNAEMRASGGFIGSYALVDFRDGEIKKIEVPGGGSYDLQGGLHKRLSAPQPLHLISSLWEFQDANWWPDWPKSAEKIEWFFENGWGSSVDGVIAIDTTFAERMLASIGPLDMREKYGEIITSENFYQVVQAQAERKDTDTPKEIITDLANTLLEQFPKRVNSNNIFTLAKEIEQLFIEKHILLNFNDDKLQNFVKEHNWEGEVKNTEGDYLMVVNTNIAGQKSDRKIGQGIKHVAEIMPDGSIINTLTITRKHNAIKGEEYVGVRNVNYLRVYTPLGSTLLEASGFLKPSEIYFDEPAPGAEIDPEIHFIENNAKVHEKSGVKAYEEFDKTVFAHWTQVDPGEVIEIKLKYKLPFKVNSIVDSPGFLTSLIKGSEAVSPYSLLAQKQPGSVNSVFFSKLILPNNMQIEVATQNVGAFKKGWEIKDNLVQDRFWGAMIKRF